MNNPNEEEEYECTFMKHRPWVHKVDKDSDSIIGGTLDV